MIPPDYHNRRSRGRPAKIRSRGMPVVLQAVSQVLPATHMVAVMRGIVLRDAGPGEMLGHVIALVVFAVILVWPSVRRVSKMTM